MTTGNMCKSIRVIDFSGGDDNWNKWSRRFWAMAIERAYLDVLLLLYSKLRQGICGLDAYMLRRCHFWDSR
jgi:hypothetical protein